MKQTLLAVFLINLMSLVALADDLKELERRYLEQEKAGLYRAIPWQPDFETAKAKAVEENKPLFVFLVVGHNGKKNASKC